MQKPVIEVISFRLKDSNSEEAFLKLNQSMEENYVSKQEGFISRETSTNQTGDWQIAVHWQNKENSEQSMAGFETAEGAESFLALMNMETFSIEHRFVK